MRVTPPATVAAAGVRPPLRIVCIDDEDDDFELQRLSLARAGLAAEMVLVRAEGGLRAALQAPPDVVLCDYNIPGFGPRQALTVLRDARVEAPMIVVTRAIGEDAVVDLFRAGASDYVAKDKLALLPQVIARVMTERAHEVDRRRVAAALARTNDHLRKVLARVVDAQERERSLIARELHDELGQTLTSVVLHLHAALRAADREALEELVRQAQALAQRAIEDIRTLSFDLRPAQLDVFGLSAAIRSTAQRLLAPTELQWTLDVRGPEPAPGQAPPQAAVALRVLREALTNALRHSAASTVQIRLRFLPDQRLVLTVADDGRGFDVASLLAGGAGVRNLGLTGMVERSESVGGRLRLRSRRGHGTVLRVAL